MAPPSEHSTVFLCPHSSYLESSLDCWSHRFFMGFQCHSNIMGVPYQCGWGLRVGRRYHTSIARDADSWTVERPAWVCSFGWCDAKGPLEEIMKHGSSRSTVVARHLSVYPAHHKRSAGQGRPCKMAKTRLRLSCSCEVDCRWLSIDT